jgi:membrane protein DedA with SNARE-associated domain
MHDVEAFILESVTWVYTTMGWPGVILLMAIESVAFPIPSELVMPLAGWLLVQARGGSVWGVALAGLYGSLGSLLGAWGVYWVSLKGGRPLLQKYGKYVLLTQEEVERAEVWFDKYGEWAVFFSRLVPVLRTLISIPAGIARMNFLKFSIYTFAGSFPWSFGLAYGGFLLGSNWETLREAMRPFEIPIILALVAIIAWFMISRIRTIRHIRAAQRAAQAQKRAETKSATDQSAESDN